MYSREVLVIHKLLRKIVLEFTEALAVHLVNLVDKVLAVMHV